MGYTDTAAYDRPLDGELTITITLAEYRELVRVSTLYEQERARDKRQKPVEMFTVDGEYLATFASGAIAGRLLGIGKSHICKVLKNEGTTCKGFIFRYGREKPNEYPGLDTRRAG